jgi:hypothetical protein
LPSRIEWVEEQLSAAIQGRWNHHQYIPCALASRIFWAVREKKSPGAARHDGGGANYRQQPLEEAGAKRV